MPAESAQVAALVAELLEPRFRTIDRRLGGLEDDLADVRAKCGALVVEEPDPDDPAKTVLRAKPATLGLDAKTVLGALVTLIVGGLVPVLIAHAA
jgi:hypothetical protein